MNFNPDKRLLILPILALTACGGTIEADYVTTTTAKGAEAPEPVDLSDTDIEILAIDAVWNSDEICPIFRDLEDSGDMEIVKSYALSSFEEGYGQELSSAGRIHLLYLMGTC